MSTTKAKVSGIRQLTIVARRRICGQFADGASEREIARREGLREDHVRTVIRTQYDVRERTLALIRVMDTGLRREVVELERQCWREHEELERAA